MTNAEIRRRILEMAYEKFQEHPYYRITPAEFKDQLSIGLRELNYNIVYLEEKGYLELQKPLEGSLFVGARITPQGVDLVEDSYLLDTLFPIPDDSTPTQLNVFKEFDLLAQQLTTAPFEPTSDTRELALEELRTIQHEVKRVAPSYRAVRTMLDRLRGHDAEIADRVAALLKHPVISRILAESAKRELEES